jgi:hypothetical protein
MVEPTSCELAAKDVFNDARRLYIEQRSVAALSVLHGQDNSPSPRENFGEIDAALSPVGVLYAKRQYTFGTLEIDNTTARAADRPLHDQLGKGRRYRPHLYNSGRISNSVKAAEVGWKTAQAEERRETLDLKLNVADAYVKVLRATQAVQAAASSVASLTSHSRNVMNLWFLSYHQNRR